MTELTETEYRTLRMKTLTILGELGARDNATATVIAAGLVSAVEAILRERVAEALDKAAVAIEVDRDLFCEGCEKCDGGTHYGLKVAAQIVREAIA